MMIKEEEVWMTRMNGEGVGQNNSISDRRHFSESADFRIKFWQYYAASTTQKASC
jgi:hypothetical protein